MSGNDVTVKLKGDGSDLNKALDESKSGIDKYAKYVKAAVIGIGAALAAQQVFSFASDSLAAYSEAYEAEGKLTRILKNRGDAIGLNIDQMKVLASNMQDLNAIEADAVISTQAVVAQFKNVNGQQFIDTLQTAADVSAQTGEDFEATSKKIAQALNDPMKGIRSLRDLGITFTDQQEEQIKKLQESGDVIAAQTILLEALGEVYGGAGAEKANEFGSRVAKLGFAIGDMQEALGGLIMQLLEGFLPVGEEVIGFFSNLVASLSESTDGIGAYTETFSGYIVDAFKYIVGISTDSFSFLEFAWKNYGAMVERTTFAWTLTVVSSYEELKYWLTEAIPGYLDWFAYNWYDVLTDIGNFEITVFSNMWENVTRFFTGLYDWLSGGQGTFEFVALTEGFESSIQELPNIAERHLTDFEKMLMQNIQQYDEQIGQSAIDIFKKNREAMDKLFEKPEKVEIEPVIKPQAISKKVDDEKKKAKDKDKADSDAEKNASKSDSKKDEKTNAGNTTDITSLAQSIQEAAIKASYAQQAAMDEAMAKMPRLLPAPRVDSKSAQAQVMRDIAAAKKGGAVNQQEQMNQNNALALIGADGQPKNDVEKSIKAMQDAGVNLTPDQMASMREEASKSVEKVKQSTEASRTVAVETAATVRPAQAAKQSTPSAPPTQSTTDYLKELYTLSERFFPLIVKAAESAGGLA